MNVLVTGRAGQLGGAIVREFSRDHDVVALTRHQLDLTDHAAILATVADVRPSIIVNCAAYNDVDGAEDDAVSALAVNAFGVRSLARAATATGATFVHYSTDFVFEGSATVPYVEDDRPNPKSMYAASKLLGEWFARDALRHYVLRLESLFGAYIDRQGSEDAGRTRQSSLDKIVDAIIAGREVQVFVDRVVSPSHVDDVAMATRALLERGAPIGLYHCVNTGMVTWFELAQEVARQLGRDSELVPVSVADVQLRAARPKFCALSNAKLAAAGIQMPSWQDALARHIALRRIQPRAPSP